MKSAELLSRLEGVKQTGTGWTALCPAHDDRCPSLSIKIGEEGRTLLRCHAGCATEDVVAAAGLQMRDLFVENGAAPPTLREALEPISRSVIGEMHDALTSKQRGRLKEERCLSDDVIDRYQIGVTLKYGALRVTIPIRNSGEEFEDVRCWLHPTRRTDGSPKVLHWETGYGGARLFPIDMLQHRRLVLVAGELDSLAMISHGIPAITATAGESTWPDALSRQIASSSVTSVTVVPDNDETGVKGSQLRAESLHAHGLAVRVASWEKRIAGWDATDELVSSGSAGMREILANAQPWSPRHLGELSGVNPRIYRKPYRPSCPSTPTSTENVAVDS